MKIAFIDIQNFRKLKSCRVEFSENKTLFVGANNSGKTSAMDALIIFLKRTRQKDISTTDFTLSNWNNINKIATDWIDNKNHDDLNLAPGQWSKYIPAIDIWVDVKGSKIHYVSHIIPTLDWIGGKLGIRLKFEPKQIEDLYKSYKSAYEAAKNTSEARKNGNHLSLWPQTMRDFLDKELHRHFTINAYILDPSKCTDAVPQELPENSEPLASYPFNGLFKIDIINAQRGFSDPNSAEDGSRSDRRLSAQLRTYFEKHLNPSELPDINDLDALDAIETARTAFDKRLKESFKASISELEGLNYPGFSDPKIQISSKVNPLEGLNHDAAVQFNIMRDDTKPGDIALCLPEKYNGLGYQNLISMIFSLIRFRDEWMRIGKAGKRTEFSDDYIEPLHIVLIEEPEAHLHAQVQQVFIKKAYDVLRNHHDLGENKQFSTQLVISTHSSHIAHEIDFKSLRYFKRMPAKCAKSAPYAEVVNLSSTFGDGSDTAKFATRYLKTTHCDLFFADAAILVEGPAERMLVPHFIKNKFPELDRNYISLLEIGGSHAHRLKPLIENLGLLTLVITDLDSIGKDSTCKVLPERGKEYRTGNDTIRSWVPLLTGLDEALDANADDKVRDSLVRAAYQYEIELKYNGEDVTAIPYTFEDALTLSNINIFKDKAAATGLIKKMADAVNKPTISEACKDLYGALGKNSKKAEMALELLYTTDPNQLEPPHYIAEGLSWMQDALRHRRQDYLILADGGEAN
ncbi:MAG: AAA family ATPase [Desulfomicrobium apsheronum]|nr:AAA family ATPase [Desulfomicrobium apsheronum]